VIFLLSIKESNLSKEKNKHKTLRKKKNWK
jgi:hypothetical protein